MLGARTTGHLYLLAQRLPRAKDTDRCVVGSDPRFDGKILHRRVLHVDAADGSLVFRLQRRSQTRDAAANRVAQLRWRLDCSFHLARERFECTVACPGPSVVINDGIPERAVEPRDRRHFVAHFDRSLEALHKSILKDVLGERTIPESSFEELAELPVVVGELQREF